MSDSVILKMDGPRDLLRQLTNGAVRHLEPAPVMFIDYEDEEPASIHVATLHLMLASSDDGEFSLFKDCMNRLLELQLLDDHGGLQDAARIFFSCSWAPEDEYVGQVLQQFIERGFIDVSRPIPGELERPDTPDDAPGMAGTMPMAAAIKAGNAVAFKILHQAGASWSLGPIVKGGPHRLVGELAKELADARATAGAAEVYAYVTEVLMNERIENSLPQFEPHSPKRTSRRASL
ncbi:hypothetical protein ABIC83_002517 [Roseateles asaccharophilus]|uniref:hypothetical protein n=1 Tax=Roseateles asaccharophilus TaxID=582607 RepID=UPI003833FDB1